MEKLYKGIFKGKKVLLTGHTGFKGSWLFLWLNQLGAEVRGYALIPATDPAHIRLLDLLDPTSIGDIRDLSCLKKTFREFQPELVFHLAAQPLVRQSYADPLETYQANVIGTAHVLEAVRHTASVRAVVNITTDKVYRNHEWIYPYRETDALGGHDPYSTSKACAELVHESYRVSFFKDSGVLSATARAGNVIGGGDWAADRLIPDIIKASVRNVSTEIRNPGSVRPWQHVLDPLSGYLLLGERLLSGDEGAEGAWNFGPDTRECLSVAEVLGEFGKYWDGLRWNDVSAKERPHEANLLRLDCSKAMGELDWSPVWDIHRAIGRTAAWYRLYYDRQVVPSPDDLRQYIADAREKRMIWTA